MTSVFVQTFSYFDDFQEKIFSLRIFKSQRGICQENSKHAESEKKKKTNCLTKKLRTFAK